MRKVVLLPMVLVLSSCEAATPSALAIRVELDRQVLILGDTIGVSVTVTNISDRQLTLSGSSTCLLGFEVRQGRRLVLDPAAGNCTDDLNIWPLDPGEEFGWTIPWAGTGTDGKLLPPGTYTLRGVALTAESVEVSSDAQLTIRSP